MNEDEQQPFDDATRRVDRSAELDEATRRVDRRIAAEADEADEVTRLSTSRGLNDEATRLSDVRAPQGEATRISDRKGAHGLGPEADAPTRLSGETSQSTSRSEGVRGRTDRRGHRAPVSPPETILTSSTTRIAYDPVRQGVAGAAYGVRGPAAPQTAVHRMAPPPPPASVQRPAPQRRRSPRAGMVILSITGLLLAGGLIAGMILLLGAGGVE